MTGLRHTINHDDPTEALRTEWLLTNGLGGYAMGTALGVNTRRYHGLLVAATRPPVGRIVAVHSLIEELVIDGETIPLSTQQFGEDMKLHPDGWTRMVEFQAERRLRWRYRIGPIEVDRWLEFGWGTRVDILYQIMGLESHARLRVRPLAPLRDFHSLRREQDGGGRVRRGETEGIEIARDDVTLLMAMHDSAMQEAHWRDEEQWWRSITYREDRARGQDWTEDVWSPGFFEIDLMPDDSGELLPGLSAIVREIEDGGGRTYYRGPGTPIDRLKQAAGSFIVERHVADEVYESVIAGYPWFADWGRDTMIALPGLLLCTGRYDEAKSTLLSFARHLQRGLMPNVFNDDGQGAAYNTVDASLWFVHAVRLYINESSDDDVQELLDACRAILFAYRNGTDFDIRLCEDGLITAGKEGSQLTWMDAMREGVVFTPRHGKAVEINALWHNALLSFAELTTDERERRELTDSARRTARAMREKFWWPEKNCLHDVLIPDGDQWRPDGKLRPNQIFAVSLPFSSLTDEQQRSVVEVVRDRLLTPFGLRTLDPADPGYRGRYEGDLMQRDAAYHNGTAWPWLIGPYCDAVLRVGNYSDEARAEVRQVIDPLLGELDRGCLNQIAEVYDGDEPQRASGCPAQAWSVAELLRILTLVVKPTVAG